MSSRNRSGRKRRRGLSTEGEPSALPLASVEPRAAVPISEALVRDGARSVGETAREPSALNERGVASRRTFLWGALAGSLAGAAATAVVWRPSPLGLPWGRAPEPVAPPFGPASQNLAMPGVYRGKVVEVRHPGSVTPRRRVLYDEQGKPHLYNYRDEELVHQMLGRALRDLVGSDHAVEAWRHFFQPRDRVGIKVVPVGRPNSISSHELIRAIIAGLQTAGVRRSDILVFDRYKNEFVACRYPDELPDGVRWECASVAYDGEQVDIDGQLPTGGWEDRVSGYDRDVFRELPFCSPEHDPLDDRRFRSHLCNIVSKKIDKFISVPVLKDHRSAGVTITLKNMSHGLVNNVARSHIHVPKVKPADPGGTLNQCGTFIPAIVSLPTIREKAVLQIVDGLVGTYEGGPGNWNRSFATWNLGSLLVGTDPVAIDRIGWEIIDRQRLLMGWPAVAEMGLSGKTAVRVNGVVGHEQFHMRQPEHISLAATLSLGTFTRSEIDHHFVELA